MHKATFLKKIIEMTSLFMQNKRKKWQFTEDNLDNNKHGNAKKHTVEGFVPHCDSLPCFTIRLDKHELHNHLKSLPFKITNKWTYTVSTSTFS